MPATNPNLNGSGLIVNGLSTGLITVGTGATTILTVPTSHLYRVGSINFLNNDTVARTITWQVQKGYGGVLDILGGGATPLSLTPGSPLFVRYGGLNLQDGDVLQAIADLANKVHVLVSYDDLY